MISNFWYFPFKADTSVGTPIYKLRASDADENYPLEFRIYGKPLKYHSYYKLEYKLLR